ncbi:type I-E CRISPR-associated protein Cas6/Cse3/CasE [Nonomuraea cavernae]|uniref:Type I-E CRISPR-associated protein Cas6/Cse3/CasE n=1 Tax=Nonomuraea cavernae TaxID=2045107 RepID=A0A917ZDG7_9ACTN|nr:type I-E CRISPR-associated protein Cas6/Cse3/CasE [Nonomuraea cavernae]MCA2190625.1 type I-E CRISPR-associated protein Cas6/Cse3/CasE [Nonomuraea cavernae]GGO81320.1 type I-E CRISPR-associated protein Cas6/Cse3/CasE [Nonomuraea cavernae]
MTAWLTRIVLEPRSKTAQRDLRDAEALHKRVMSLVPDGLGEQARAKAGVLYRYDETGAVGPHLLVQSGLPIDAARLPQQYGSLAVRDLTLLLDLLHSDLAVRYRIVGNTTKRLGRTSERAGKLLALRGAEADQWWHARAEANGLILRTLTSTPLPDVRGKGPGAVRHAATRFDGLAVVKDPDLVRQAVLNGIGRGKAYGCGLLSLAPLVT